MTDGQQAVRLCMVRAHLDDIPAFALPEGLAVRGYQPGDEQAWLALHREVAPELGLDEARYWAYFSRDVDALKLRQLLAVTARGEVAGTLTAWRDAHGDDGAWGRIHYVAVARAWQGRGVAHALMTLGCQRLAELGDRRAYLVTDDSRPRAIHVYRRFGFEAHVHGDRDRAAWADLQPRLRGAEVAAAGA